MFIEMTSSFLDETSLFRCSKLLSYQVLYHIGAKWNADITRIKVVIMDEASLWLWYSKI